MSESKSEFTYSDNVPHIENQIRRNKPDGIIEAVQERGKMRVNTMLQLIELIESKTDYKCHIAVEINTGPMLKTVDNEEDALETIRRLLAKPAKEAK